MNKWLIIIGIIVVIVIVVYLWLNGFSPIGNGTLPTTTLPSDTIPTPPALPD